MHGRGMNTQRTDRFRHILLSMMSMAYQINHLVINVHNLKPLRYTVATCRKCISPSLPILAGQEANHHTSTLPMVCVIALRDIYGIIITNIGHAN